MIEQHLRLGPARTKLASVVREINALHNQAGGDENPDLKEAWLRLDRGLQMASLSGDDRAAFTAVERYRAEGLAACENQQKRLTRNRGRS